jgi:hypothetical protein
VAYHHKISHAKGVARQKRDAPLVRETKQGGGVMGEVYLKADLRTGASKSVEVTLSGTPGEVTSLAVLEGAEGVKIYPASDVRFALNGDPAAKASSSDASIAASALAAGAIAKAGQWETRLLQPGTGRTLRMASATASVVVEVEFF